MQKQLSKGSNLLNKGTFNNSSGRRSEEPSESGGKAKWHFSLPPPQRNKHCPGWSSKIKTLELFWLQAIKRMLRLPGQRENSGICTASRDGYLEDTFRKAARWGCKVFINTFNNFHWHDAYQRALDCNDHHPQLMWFQYTQKVAAFKGRFGPKCHHLECLES